MLSVIYAIQMQCVALLLLFGLSVAVYQLLSSSKEIKSQTQLLKESDDPITVSLRD